MMKKTTKQLTIKAGSIFPYKEYGVFARMMAKIKGKELPYNKFIGYAQDTIVYVKNLNDTKDIILEPKKNYSNKEALMFSIARKVLCGNMCRLEFDDILVLINSVRPGTIEITKDVANLIGNKYYKVRRLSDENEYTEYIY